MDEPKIPNGNLPLRVNQVRFYFATMLHIFQGLPHKVSLRNIWSLWNWHMLHFWLFYISICLFREVESLCSSS